MAQKSSFIGNTQSLHRGFADGIILLSIAILISSVADLLELITIAMGARITFFFIFIAVIHSLTRLIYDKKQQSNRERIYDAALEGFLIISLSVFVGVVADILITLPSIVETNIQKSIIPIAVAYSLTKLIIKPQPQLVYDAALNGLFISSLGIFLGVVVDITTDNGQNLLFYSVPVASIYLLTKLSVQTKRTPSLSKEQDIEQNYDENAGESLNRKQETPNPAYISSVAENLKAEAKNSSSSSECSKYARELKDALKESNIDEESYTEILNDLDDLVKRLESDTRPDQLDDKRIKQIENTTHRIERVCQRQS